MSTEVQVFDLRSEPCELAEHRWSRHAHRDPAALRGSVLHAWDAEVGTTVENRNRWGEAGALARRGLRAPYGVSCGVTRSGIPVVALCHPLERYTFASDAGNRHYLSIGVMGVHPFTEAERTSRHTPMSPALAAAIGAALAAACDLLAKAGAGDGPWPLLTHRQCINGPGDHDHCPGEAVVAAALASAPVADGLLVADPNLVLVPEFGKPWPEAWRRRVPLPRQVALALADPVDVD